MKAGYLLAMAAISAVASAQGLPPVDQPLGPRIEIETLEGSVAKVFVASLDEKTAVVLVPKSVLLSTLTTKSKVAIREAIQSGQLLQKSRDSRLETELDEAKKQIELLRKELEAAKVAPTWAPSSVAGSPGVSSDELTVGSTYSFLQFSVTLDSVSVGKPPLTAFIGGATTSKDDLLIVKLTIANFDERKILAFSDGEIVGDNPVTLTDDVDNTIVGVSFGLSARATGALKNNARINPGTQESHVELFEVPPPKTEFLTLRFHAECLDGEGVADFKIPANAIQGFQRQ